MINVRLNYFLLQVINAALFLISYLFVRDYLGIDESKTLTGSLVLLSLILAGAYVFYTNRIFYMLIKHREK